MNPRRPARRAALALALLALGVAGPAQAQRAPVDESALPPVVV